jgi:hypothetical protein
MKKTISVLNRTKFTSKYLNIDYWLEISKTDKEAVENCKRARSFKAYFLFSKFNTDWKDIESYIERCIDVQNLVINKNIKSIKEHPLFGQNRTFLTYWQFRGFSLDESAQKLSKFQSDRSKIKNVKYTKEERKSFSNRCASYWIAKGHTEDEAKEIISKNQVTFSLEKLLEKYDRETALSLMEDRNRRWQQSLNENNNMEEVNKRKDSASLDYFIAKYGDNEEARILYEKSCYICGTSSRGEKRTTENCTNISKGLTKQFKMRRLHDGTDYSGIVYFLHFKELNAVKIGLTNGKSYRFNSLEKTFGKFEVLHIIETDRCFETENYFHEFFNDFSKPIVEIKTNGWTEFFSEDIIPLINNSVKLDIEVKNERNNYFY